MALRAILFGASTALANMIIPTLEISSGVHMPVLSIGTGGLESDECAAIVDNWLSLEGKGIDTAYIYKDQEVIAKSIADAGIDRKDLFITTKIPTCYDAETYVQQDLQQLGTDYIDLLLIHFPQPMLDCAATWATLEDYVAKGVLRAIGVSQFKSSDLHALMRTAKMPPAVLQMQHNIIEHDYDTIATAQSYNITIEAFSPLGRSGHSGDIPGNAVVQEVAAAHGVSTYQVALKWIIQHGHILTFQSTSKKHQASDADLWSFTLTDSEMAALDAVSPSAETAVI